MMADARYGTVVNSQSLGSGPHGPTFVDRGWTAASGAGPIEIAKNATASPWAQLSARPVDEASTWKAAELALAEIAWANRPVNGGAPRDPANLQRAAAAVRDNLVEAANAAADAARRARALAESLDEAIAVLAGTQMSQLAPMPKSALHSASGTAQLSQREREVLQQVAEGRTNKAIAAELYVSPNTVKTHVASLLRKMNVDTRAQLAAIAVRQGLR